MSSNFQSVLANVENGRKGNNKGIPIPFPRLKQYLPNIQRAVYYLIGAGTKVGKTSLVDDIFFFGALDHKLANPESFNLDIDYFSYEINIQSKIVKCIARQMWHDFGLLVDVNTILSRGENYCSDEIYELVKGYADYFQRIEDFVTIMEMPDNPTGVYNYLRNKAEKRGTVTKKNVNKDPKGDPIMKFDKYTADDPELYWMGIIDHIALQPLERGFTVKQNIDKMSQYVVLLRNNFGLTPVIIQQLNFDTDNDERYKSNRLTPTLRDFGDSKYTTRDAEVIMTLFSPYRHNLMQFEGYDIGKLGNRFRSLEILENRFGEPNINIGLNFIDVAGTFRELPSPKDMTADIYNMAANMINGRSKYIKDAGVWKIRK